MMMKKILISCLLLLVALQSQAGGDKYVKAMEGGLKQMEAAKTPEQFQDVANRFERIGNAEEKEWLPWYYASQAYLTISWTEKDGTKKDAYLDKAQTYIDQADKLKPNESEIYVIKGQIFSSRIGVDPQTRGMVFGPKAAMNYGQAISLNEENPRGHSSLGMNTLYTPEQFGGGVDKAMPMLGKAKEKYGTFKPESSIHPNWGEETLDKTLKWVADGMPSQNQSMEPKKEEKNDHDHDGHDHDGHDHKKDNKKDHDHGHSHDHDHDHDHD